MKIIEFVAYATIIMAFGIISLLSYWFLYPYHPIDFKSQIYPILNENNEVKRGEVLAYEIEYCKNTEQVPYVNKKYINGLVYDTPGTRGVVHKGCRKQTVLNVVPRALVPGKYHMEIIIEYKVNPIRSVTYSNITEEFTITE